MSIIAITGGIGTGKSVVARVLRVMGYPVYDCDSRARGLMTSHAGLIASIKQLLGPEAYLADGSLNAEFISSQIFSNPQLVGKMNALVHPVVLEDIVRWAHSTGCELNFVETALFRESNMQSIVDDVWKVEAPLDVRIARVWRRSGLDEEGVRSIIDAQSNDLIETMSIIVNDNNTPIIPQLVALLAR